MTAVMGHGPEQGGPATKAQHHCLQEWKKILSSDDRVLAFELAGSFAAGKADRYSDIQYCLELAGDTSLKDCCDDWSGKLPVLLAGVGGQSAVIVMPGPVLVQLRAGMEEQTSFALPRYVMFETPRANLQARLALHLFEAVRDMKRKRFWLAEDRLAESRRLLFSWIAGERGAKVDTGNPQLVPAEMEKILSPEEQQELFDLAAVYHHKALAYAFWLVLQKSESMAGDAGNMAAVFRVLREYYQKEFGWLIYGPLVTFPLVVSAVLFNKQGKFLLLRKSTGQKAWCLPGGGVDREEEPETALQREVYEETGLSPEKFLLASLRRGQNRKVIVATYAARVWEDVRVVLAEEHDDFCWCDADEWHRLVDSGQAMQMDRQEWLAAADVLAVHMHRS